MKVMHDVGKVASVALVAALAICCPLATHASTVGKLTGVVHDDKKQPLEGANVILVGVPLGAITDATGHYTILNVPAGTYTVKVSYIGYAPTTVQNVAVSADKTTPLDVALSESAVQMKEVVVTAKRPVVELGLTSNVATVTRQEIDKLPVQDLQQIVDLQAGVVQGHFRGGRTGEVQYQVDGISVNNPYDNTATIKLDRSVLEEVQVISGTFDAEYGQAMSGVVNASLRRGTQKFTWSGEVFTGDYLWNGINRPLVSFGSAQQFSGDHRPVEYAGHLGNLQNYQLTLSGPAGLPKTLFLVSGRYGVTQSYLRGQQQLVDLAASRPDSVVLAPVKEEAVGYQHEATGLLKLSNRSIRGVEMSYEAIVNEIQGRRDGSAEWDYRLDLNGLPTQHTASVAHGFEWTHTLNPKTFYRFTVRQNYFDYRDMVYRSLWDQRYDENGPGTFVTGFENDAYVYGLVDNRFIQNTNALVFVGSINRQFKTHAMKAGFDWEPTHVTFGHPGWLVWNTDHYERHVNEPLNSYPDPSTFRPVIGSAFVQDDVEWNDLRIRAGLRFEYFNPKTVIPADPLNPANSIAGEPVLPPVAATRKLTLAPRLGVSFPVTSKSSLFFAYGHFYQMPPLGQVYDNSDFSVLRNLQASGGKDWGTFGNPDVKPERTIQYQFGYKQELRDWLGLDLTMFYKDIRDLLGSEIITTYNDAQYKKLSNGDFGNVIGVTVALDQRERGMFSSTLDYTWQTAKGNASDPYETAARVDAHEDPRPRNIVLNWDQQHTLNLTVTMAQPGNFNVSTIMRAASGQPYTPVSEAYFVETNSGRKPNAFLVDLRGEKSLFAPGVTAYLTVSNVFDARFWNGTVFASSGSPYYSRTNNSSDQNELSDPTRYYGPRRLILGVRWDHVPK